MLPYETNFPLKPIEQLQEEVQINKKGAKVEYAMRMLNENKDFAIKLLKEASETEGLAQYNLANAYYKGDGVQTNYSEASKFYEKSLKNGDIHSINPLTRIYLQESPKQIEKAIRLLNAEVKNDNRYAMQLLAYFYYQGLYGVGKDHDKALVLLNNAERLSKKWYPTENNTRRYFLCKIYNLKNEDFLANHWCSEIQMPEKDRYDISKNILKRLPI